MGASQSSTSVDVVNDSIITAIVNNVNNCQGNLTQNQQVDFSGFGLFNSVKQTATLNLQCLQNITMNNQLSMQIAQQIQQEAESQAVALMPSYSGSSNTVKLANYIQTKVATETIQNCATSAIQSQQVSFSGIQIGAAATQTLNLFSKCMQSVLNNNNVSQGVVQDITQKATSKTTNPLDFLSGIFSSIALIVIAVVIAFIFVAYYFLGGGLDSGEPDPIIIQQTSS